MNIQSLPRKVLQMLKEIYEHLNSKAYASHSGFTKRKVLNVTIATVALILSGEGTKWKHLSVR